MYGQRSSRCSSRTEFSRENWFSARSEELFLVPLVCLGGLCPTPSVSLYSIFIVVSFLLNGVPGVGACPINPSLQLLGVVVRTEKYDRIRHRALNAIMTAFPLDTSVFSVVLFCFSAFPTLWNDMECHYQWQVASLILGYIHAEEDSPHGRGKAFPSHNRGEIFPWVGSLAQCRHRRGPIDLLSPTIALQNPTIRLLGWRGGFW